MKLFKKLIAIMLTAVILLSEIAVPISYAQDIPTETATAKFTTLATDTVPAPQTILDGQGMSIDSLVPALGDNKSWFGEAGFTETAMVRKLAKENYRPNEDVEVVIENGVNKEYKTELIDAIGNKVAIEMDTVDTGATKVITLEQPSSFKPGKYTLRISDNQGGVSEQDFSWGVLAINPDKSVYAPDEIANLAFGVLDEGGNMVCDAQVELTIKTPKDMIEILSTDNGKIKVNPECETHDFTLNPDYSAAYTVGGAGVYKMELKAQTRNGQFSITDSFEVRQTVPFDVKRVTATRIYPPHQYPVTMEITANQDFEGTITETVPASFKISRPSEEIKTDKDEVDEEIAKQIEEANAAETENTNTDSSTVIPTKVGIQEQNVDPGSESGMTNSMQNTVKQTAPIAPDNLPINQFIPGEVLGYSTINDLQQNSGVKAVLGASVPGLGMPFVGNFPVSQEFGESLVHDVHDHDLYASFGMSGHDGIDFGVPVGTPLLSVDNGKVLLAGDGDYGTTIVIQHAWGRSYYGHLSAVSVKDGDEVQRGQTIGASGNTGISTGPHLHFGLKPDSNDSENGYYGKVDPAYYLGMKQSAASVLGVATSTDDAAAETSTFPTTPETDVKILTWKVSVKKGDKIKIGYNYLAPRISPQFYTLGPATFTDTTGKEIFHEIRKWQIAADALEYKFKQGNFTKSTCVATCTQKIGGVGFKPKAVIFEWTRQANEGTVGNMLTGMGFATIEATSSAAQERAVSAWSQDAVGTSNAGNYRSKTKVIVMQGATGGNPIAAADFVSFDNDGFTLSWTTNNFTPDIINYTAIGGSDVSNAKAGSFMLSTGTGSYTNQDPGFRPDFMMFMGISDGPNETDITHASIHLGVAASPVKEGSVVFTSEDNQGTSDTWSQHRTDAAIAILEPSTGAQNAIADLTSFDALGFTLNKSDGPVANTEVFYLALQGGQYDVGAFVQPSTNGTQSVYTGFKPSGMMLMSASNSATPTITANSAFSVGGGSAANASSDPWCNDTLDITCTGPGSQTISNTLPTDWCNDTTGVTCGADWSTRKKITFNNATMSGTLTDFPVLVKLDSTRIDYTKTQDDGDDLRFVDPNDKTTVLPHEIETWDEFGTSYVWVKVPTLDAVSGADFIWMYYGNTSVSSGQDAANVWDGNFRNVYHMKGTNGSATIPDSATGNSTENGTKESGTSAGSPANTTNGKISAAQDFTAPDYVEVSGLMGSPANVTLEAWVNVDALDGSGSHAISFGDALILYIDGSSVGGAFYHGAGNWQGVSGTASITGTGWRKMSFVYNDTLDRQYIYLDGSLIGTTSFTQSITYAGLGANTQFGRHGNTDTTFDYDGRIDEVRISNTARSAAWISATYLTENDGLNTFGPEEFNNVWCDDTSGVTCSSSWTTRKKITFDDTAASAGAQLKDFPVLVKLNSARIDYSKTKSAGEDIRFVDPGDPKTVLSHEIESWNESGDSYVWVKVPQLDTASGTDFVWMYYNNSSASSGQDATNVWESNYRNVWHMNENPGGGAPQIQDSTTNNNDATSNGSMNSADLVAGRIANSVDFDGSDDYLDAGDINALDGISQMTAEAWIRQNSPAEYMSIIYKGSSDSSRWFLSTAGVFDSGSDDIALGIGNGAVSYAYTTNNILANSTGQWVHLVMAYDGTLSGNDSRLKLFVNGVQQTLSYSLTIPATLPSNAAAVQMGGDFAGQIDEVRTATTARSVDWARATYVSQTDRMNTFGPAQNLGEKTAEPAGWAYRKKITFNNASSSADLVDFPALVKLNTTRIDYNKTQDSGQDIRFVDPTNPSVVLPHEIENWNETGESNVWVKVPQVDGNSAGDYVWMYYGNRYAPDGQNAKQVWESGFEGVWHLGENPAEVSTGGIQDATFNSNDGTDNGSMNASDTVNAKIGKGLDFDGTDDYVEVPFNSDFRLNDSFSIEFWSRFTGAEAGSFPSMLSFGTGASEGWLVYETAASNNVSFKRDVHDGNITQGNSIDSTTLRHYSITYDEPNGIVRGYVNGVQQVQAAETYAHDISTNVLQMADGDDQANIILDEVRISSAYRSPGWIVASYLSQEDRMNTFGHEETPDGVSNQYSQGNIWADDADNAGTTNANMSTSSTTIIRTAASPVGGTAPRTTSEAELQSIDSTGFKLNWTTTDSTARQIIYWAAGSVTASQDDYRWYKNANSATPDTALEDENSHTIISKNKPYARLRANMSTGGNGMNAMSQGFKLQYAAAGAVAGAASVNDWCNDTTGIMCTAPQAAGTEIQASTPTDWCNDTTGVTCTTEWSSRRMITFNNATSSAMLTNFPVLVKLDSTRIDYSKTQSNGEDLRFVDPSAPTTALNHEIESWNESGTSYVWVEVPQIDARSTTDYIWMYYGNSSVSSPATQLGNSTHENGTWDSVYRAVYHLSNNSFTNSVSSSYNGTNSGTANTTGKIGDGRAFVASESDYINLGNNSNILQNVGGATITAWVNPTSIATDVGTNCVDGDLVVFISNNLSAISSRASLCVADISGYTFGGIGRSADADSFQGNISSTRLVTASQWQHIATVLDYPNDVNRLYYNGEAVATAGTISYSANTTANTASLRAQLGAVDGGGGGADDFFNGSMDEVRIAASTLSQDWMKADYLSMTDTYNTYGTEYTQSEVKQSSTGWQYRKKITFNNASASASLSTNASESGNLVDFPVLVKLDSSRIDYTKTQDDGGDIRFVDPSDNSTVLSHEIETWNENGVSIVWVKVPQLDANSTTDSIWMYYGNPGASDGQNATGVWTNQYSHVYHLNGVDTNSVNGNTSATFGANAVTTTGVFGSGLTKQSNYSGDSMTVTEDRVSTKSTVQTWFKPDGFRDWDNIIFQAWVGNGLLLYTDAGGTPCFGVGNGGNQYNSCVPDIPDSKWTMLAGTYSSSYITSYHDGEKKGWDEAITGGSTDLTSDISILADTDRGTVDEVRISSIDRTPEWLEADYRTQSDLMNSFSEEIPYTTSSANQTAGWIDVADPWCNDSSGVTCGTEWNYRKKISFNTVTATGSALTNFPVLVKLDPSRIDYTKVQDDGDDLRFVDPADPTVVLDHEIESWNEQGASFVWVEVPSLQTKSTTDAIWMYYGNSSASSGQNSENVWDSNYNGVWHLKEDPSVAGSGGILDSTSNNNDGTDNGSMNSADQVQGKVNGSLNFDGSDDDISVVDHDSLTPTNDMAVSFWVKLDRTASSFGEDMVFINKQHSGAPWYSYLIYQESAGGDANKLRAEWVNNSSTVYGAVSSTVLQTGVLYHITFVKSGSSIKLYVNGVDTIQSSDTTTGTILNTANPMYIATDNNTKHVLGIMDEVRLSGTGRSADWVKAEYLTQADQMNSFGSEETQSTHAWKFKDNASVGNGSTITSAKLGTSATGNQMSYLESSAPFLIPTALAVGERREFDFSLDGTNTSSRRTYYFRIVNADGEPLTNYTRYPSITVGVPNQKVMRGGKFFNYKQTQPFTF